MKTSNSWIDPQVPEMDVQHLPSSIQGKRGLLRSHAGAQYDGVNLAAPVDPFVALAVTGMAHYG